MKISNSEFTSLGAQLILPVFEDTKKAPNNSLNGLNRSQRGLVRDVLGSGDFEGKKGTRKRHKRQRTNESHDRAKGHRQTHSHYSLDNCSVAGKSRNDLASSKFRKK